MPTLIANFSVHHSARVNPDNILAETPPRGANASSIWFMLIIRKQQMDALAATMGRRFRETLKMHLRQDLREETGSLSDEMLLRRMDAAIARARQHGLSSERDLALFVDLDFTLGQNFENQRNEMWIKRILTQKETAAAAKMDLIYQRLAAQQTAPAQTETNG